MQNTYLRKHLQYQIITCNTNTSYIYIEFLKYFGCAGSSFARRLSSSCSEQGLLSLVVHGLSLQRLFLLQSTRSRCTGFRSCNTWTQQLWSQALEHRFNSCGSWAQLLLVMWDLPGSGIEPRSPALASRFFTSEPTWKPDTNTSIPKYTKQQQLLKLNNEKTNKPVLKWANRYLTKEDIRMANKCMKRSSAAFVMSELQIETTMKCHYIPQNG